MTTNVGKMDRVFRALGAIGMLAAAFLAPLPVEVRVPLFGLLAAYMSFTALAGTCLGYKLMGMSTCPVRARS